MSYTTCLPRPTIVTVSRSAKHLLSQCSRFVISFAENRHHRKQSLRSTDVIPFAKVNAQFA